MFGSEEKNGSSYSRKLSEMFRIEVIVLLHQSPYNSNHPITRYDHLQIEEIEEWPSKACKECVRLLDEMLRLRAKIISTQEKLAEIASTYKVEILAYESHDEVEKSSIEIIAIDPEKFCKETGTEGAPSPPFEGPRTRKKDTARRATADDAHEPLNPPSERLQQENLMREMKLLICSICGTESESFKSFQSHMRGKHKMTNASIMCCNRKFGRAYALNHIKYHLDKDAFKCPQCDKRFLAQYKLDFHVTNSHVRPEMVQFSCEVCGKGYVDKWLFSVHQKTHLSTEERPFKCKLCSFASNSAMGVKLHVATAHSAQRDHTCEVCGKSFPNPYRLSSHTKRSHQEAITKQCEICHKFFFNLPIHMRRMHTDTEKVKCEHCDYRCNRINMNKHVFKYHTGERPRLTCHICAKEYKTKRSLKEHINGHMGIRFKCDFCSLESTTSGNYYNHVTQKHPVEYEQLKAERRAAKCSQARVKNAKIPPGDSEKQ